MPLYNPAGSGGGSGTVTSVAATDTSIVVTGTPTIAPTLAVATLDVIAADHPPAADWSNNSHKITSLANGSGAQDAAAFGQIPATLDAVGAPAGNVSLNSHKITNLTNGSGAQDAAAFGQVPVADSTAANILAVGTQAAGANAKWADSGHVHPATGWTIADYGLLACNMIDPALAQSTQITIAGTIYLMRINIRKATTATNICFFVTTAASGSSTTTFAGIYNSAGTLLSGSSDIGSNLTSTGLATCPLTTPQALSAGSFYWAALLTNFGTTQPTLAKSGTSGSVSNAGLSAATFRQAINGTGASSLPALTPSSNTVTNSFLFAAGIS